MTKASQIKKRPMKTWNYGKFTVSQLQKEEFNKSGWVEYKVAMSSRDSILLEIAIFFCNSSLTKIKIFSKHG